MKLPDIRTLIAEEFQELLDEYPEMDEEEAAEKAIDYAQRCIEQWADYWMDNGCNP